MRMLRAVAVGLAFSLGSLPSWGQSVVAVSPDITVESRKKKAPIQHHR